MYQIATQTIEQTAMEITNRTTKLLSKYIASKDELRPQLQGVAIDGPNMIACDGHIMAVVEGVPGSEHFADPGLYLIDDSQRMNDTFEAEQHSFITESEYPQVRGIVPTDEDYVYNEVKVSVEVLSNLVKYLKGIDSGFVQFKFSQYDNKPILWEAFDPCHKDVHMKRTYGLMMPMRLTPEIKTGNPFTHRAERMQALVDAVNETVNKLNEED